MKVSPAALAEVQRALKEYMSEVEDTNLTDLTKKTYLLHAEHFVRWLADDFEPGARVR